MIMFICTIFVIIASTSVFAAPADLLDANEYCLTCHGRSNSRNLFEHPTDCHKYYQCVFESETQAVGYLHDCPPSTYFNAHFQACIYEGPYPCTDHCTYNSTVNRFGCANIPGSCSLYIKCSTGTEFQCCPPKTRFDSSVCQCVDDESCTEPCSLPAPAIPSTVQPPTFNDTHCTDSWGNVLTGVANHPDHYGLVDTSNGEIYVRPCALGSNFNLQECRCGENAPVVGDQPSGKQCFLYLPFDSDTADHSKSKFTTFVYGGADFTSDFAARGSGSFSTVNGGRMEIPGTKNIELQYQSSFCLFYRCPNGNCPQGGLLSNNDKAEMTVYSLILASLADNGLIANFKMQYPWSENSVSTTVTAGSDNDFNQVCATFDGRNFPFVDMTLYVNNQFAARTTQNYSMLSISTCPFTVGTDQKYGDFAGYIDEVLLCPFVFGSAEIDAHYQGQAQLRALNLIP